MKGKSGSERRHVQRFSLKAFAIVQNSSPSAEEVFEVSTKDISSGGAFFPMELPLRTGEKVKITLLITIPSPERIGTFPTLAKITTEGQVVRSTTWGVAVAFNGHYTISPAVR